MRQRVERVRSNSVAAMYRRSASFYLLRRNDLDAGLGRIANGPAMGFVIVFSGGIVSRATITANGRPSAFLARNSSARPRRHRLVSKILTGSPCRTVYLARSARSPCGPISSASSAAAARRSWFGAASLAPTSGTSSRLLRTIRNNHLRLSAALPRKEQ
jgi:hypothetical protein